MEKVLRNNVWIVFIDTNVSLLKDTLIRQSKKIMHIQTPVYLFITINIIYTLVYMVMGFPGSASGKEPACQCRRH